MKRRLIQSLLILFGVLFASEWAARRLLPAVPSCADAPRQPFRYRGWPEYLRGVSRQAGTGRVVLITNCQGYGGEYPASKGYPAALEQLLTDRKVGGYERWEVLNWAVDGVTPMEYVVLATFLRGQEPDVVLTVTGYADFRTENLNEGYFFCRTDVPRLATRLPVARALPRSFLRRHLKVEDTLASWMSDRFALVRVKEFMWSWLDRRFPGIHNVFYAPLLNYLPWAVKERAWVTPLRIKVPSDLAVNINYGPECEVMLREYLRELSQAGSHVVLVSEPRKAPEEGNVKDAEYQALFLSQAERLALEFGIRFWDLQDALPQDAFLTSNHFHRRNHVRMAEVLAERIEQLLNGTTGAAG